ncbi:MAG: hypothetical protein HC824_20675 [Synechococcales cyanobacterium RM1_1_8]|nr:hypothetical protein [Synechococcales cyanobacterium RM1_1_8]
MATYASNNAAHSVQTEDFSGYVAQLQLHMSLQARNLVPHLSQVQNSPAPNSPAPNSPAQDSRTALLHETQARCEKQISRQT